MNKNNRTTYLVILLVAIALLVVGIGALMELIRPVAQHVTHVLADTLSIPHQHCLGMAIDPDYPPGCLVPYPEGGHH